MTEPETSQPVPENETSVATATEETPAPETEAEPPPEPWTPERVSEWNAYYDFYVKLAALLLVFMVSCNYVTDSHVWMHLKTGQLIAEQGCAGQDRRFLLHGRRPAVGRRPLAFPVGSRGDLQAGPWVGPR